ncbi:hypothetical protein ABZ485_28180 [Streptomyces albogriseolus]|uniref:hypothetical protein n=1 Tax=Streptomyces albogriseolus TaxID=1887 RepID=UPI0034604955
MNTQQTLKTAALAATLTAAGVLGYQITTGTAHPAAVGLTVLAAVLVGLSLRGEIRQAARTLLHRPMTGRRFRKTHGDPAQWDDDEYDLFAAYATPGDPTPARELLARLQTPTA